MKHNLPVLHFLHINPVSQGCAQPECDVAEACEMSTKTPIHAMMYPWDRDFTAKHFSDHLPQTPKV
jgi:hypothetical protein